jgi:hypothetical protein
MLAVSIVGESQNLTLRRRGAESIGEENLRGVGEADGVSGQLRIGVTLLVTAPGKSGWAKAAENAYARGVCLNSAQLN